MNRSIQRYRYREASLPWESWKKLMTIRFQIFASTFTPTTHLRNAPGRCTASPRSYNETRIPPGPFCRVHQLLSLLINPQSVVKNRGGKPTKGIRADARAPGHEHQCLRVSPALTSGSAPPAGGLWIDFLAALIEGASWLLRRLQHSVSHWLSEVQELLWAIHYRVMCIISPTWHPYYVYMVLCACLHIWSSLKCLTSTAISLKPKSSPPSPPQEKKIYRRIAHLLLHILIRHCKCNLSERSHVYLLLKAPPQVHQFFQTIPMHYALLSYALWSSHPLAESTKAKFKFPRITAATSPGSSADIEATIANATLTKPRNPKALEPCKQLCKLKSIFLLAACPTPANLLALTASRPQSQPRSLTSQLRVVLGSLGHLTELNSTIRE